MGEWLKESQIRKQGIAKWASQYIDGKYIYLKTSLLIQFVIVSKMVSACNKTYNVGVKRRPTSSFFSTSGIIGKKVCKIMNFVFNICDKNTIFVKKNNPVNKDFVSLLLQWNAIEV